MAGPSRDTALRIRMQATHEIGFAAHDITSVEPEAPTAKNFLALDKDTWGWISPLANLPPTTRFQSGVGMSNVYNESERR